jgi:hypothetical protein
LTTKQGANAKKWGRGREKYRKSINKIIIKAIGNGQQERK